VHDVTASATKVKVVATEPSVPRVVRLPKIVLVAPHATSAAHGAKTPNALLDRIGLLAVKAQSALLVPSEPHDPLADLAPNTPKALQRLRVPSAVLVLSVDRVLSAPAGPNDLVVLVVQVAERDPPVP